MGIGGGVFQAEGTVTAKKLMLELVYCFGEATGSEHPSKTETY